MVMKRLFEAQRRHSEFYCDLFQQFDNLYFKGGDDNISSALGNAEKNWLQIEHGQRWSRTHYESSEAVGKLCIDYLINGRYLFELRTHPAEQVERLNYAVLSAKKYDARSEEGHLLSMLGMAHEDLSQIDRAESCYRQQLHISTEVDNSELRGMALGNLGRISAIRDEYKQAIEYYEQDLKITEQAQDMRGQAISLMNIGIAYSNLNELSDALAYYNRALSITQEAGDRRTETDALGATSKLPSRHQCCIWGIGTGLF